MRYTVDIKAFISVTVEADTPQAARMCADDFVHSLSPDPAFTDGYGGKQRLQAKPASIVSAGEFDIDGRSDVEAADADEPRCQACGRAEEVGA